MSSFARYTNMAFPTPHIRAPQNDHTHTAILLHGRGSNGPEFAEELFSSLDSNGMTLPDRLPKWRWVFPTSPLRWSPTFQEDLRAWFEAYSLDDIQEKQELQVAGLQESVTNILMILEDEIKKVGGHPARVYLGGISQGMAIALWTLLCAPGRLEGPLGGVMGFCGWLPFAHELEDLNRQVTGAGESQAFDKQLQASRFLLNIIGSSETSNVADKADISVMSSPVFLSHGTDDAWVSVELGRQAARVLEQIKMSVEWHEFTGAEGDGHWIQEPQGFDQILHFIEKQLATED